MLDSHVGLNLKRHHRRRRPCHHRTPRLVRGIEPGVPLPAHGDRQAAQATVEQEFRDGRFAIRTDEPGARVSWQITGIRHDPWARKNRPKVEQVKPAPERGRYLHPRLYGRPQELSVTHVASVPEPVATADVGETAGSTGHDSEPTGSCEKVTGAVPMDEEGNVYAKSFRPSSTDLASLVPVAEPVTAGDVLVIDSDGAGSMSLGRVSEDTAVFGIVAAAPGVVLGATPPERATAEHGEASDPVQEDLVAPVDVPVAVSGVVHCKVDAGYGSIRPGDLLTTSPTAGHAKRADPHIGTVVGKALEPLDTGTGLIKVLVMLR